VCGRIGERICGENINLWDDGMDPRGRMTSFDYEGMPRQPVALIDGGIAAGLVYDTRTARREGRSSTGHATGSSSMGPVPTNLFLGAGDATTDEMVSSTERGLLVTRFHYTNIVNPKQTVLTGMTRDGTFLIEDGRLVSGVRNLRFTQSVLEALGRVEMVGAEGAYMGMVWAPALKIRDFTFTGTTEF